MSHEDVITAEYIDADDGNGGFDVPVQSTTTADCIGPIISGIAEQNITDTAATVVWTTSEPADTELIWGDDRPPANQASGASGVTEHQVDLTGLASCTSYFYEVSSTDPSGNNAADDNGGQYFRFETFGDFGEGLQPCHAGRVFLGAEAYSCGATLTFELIDLDLNTDPAVVEAVDITVSSSTETEPEIVTATEISANSSRFAGSITLSQGAAAPDGVLQVSHGDLLSATYTDADDGTGAPAYSFATATMDCGGPEIRNVRISGLTDQRFTISFDTTEPADTLVEWGTTAGLGNVESDPALATTHSILLNDADICQQLFLRVSSTDAYGNTSVADAEGSPFTFSTWDIPGLYYRETFENGANGWSLSGDFEIGAPRGLGGSSGNGDPAVPYNANAILGDDLSGLDAHAGDYEHESVSTATSPNLDAQTWTNTQLRLVRHLNVRSDDDASIVVTGKGGAGGPVWNSLGATITDSGYGVRVYDVSALMDGQRTTGLEFGMNADDESTIGFPGDDGISSGWNIDDVILKDGTLPDYGTCGGCGTGPAFAGAVSASDNDACGAGGVTVSWEEAVAWGTGGTGTYSVYRDTAPGFTPSAGNRVATGIAGLSYVDAAAPDGSTLYYLVRAENDETCGTGPNNGGMTDGNAVYVPVSTSSSQGIPVAIEPLLGDLVNRAHVRLSWPAVADATQYRVYRSATPDPAGFVLLGETAALYYEDAGEGGTLNAYYYLVKGVNACGQEGP